MSDQTAFFLKDLWYYALPGGRLRPGAMMARRLLGEPVLLGRAADGSVFALRDICPHRGIPLSHGRFDGAEVECCYHGWRFDTAGGCTAIPSLTDEQDFDLARIKVRRYPCREVQGNIWVWMGAGEPDQEIPELPGVGPGAYRLVETMTFTCHVDHAVVGLMDPAHGPYVHRSWWWRTKRSMHEKAKPFGPSTLGFTMRRHRPSSNSRAYLLVGGVPETEIAFRLPGVRIEHVSTGRHHLVGLTAVTPVDEQRTEITQAFYWTMPWLSVARPVLRRFVRAFLNQDRRVVEMQQEGLRHNPSLMLIRDADVQARWYYQLKNEFTRAAAEGRPFKNPVPEKTLRWRS